MPNQSDPNQNQQTVNDPQPVSPPVVEDTPPAAIPDIQAGDLPQMPSDSAVTQVITDPPKEEESTPPSDVSSVISSTPKKKFGGGKIIATILGILFLVGGVAAGIILTQQRQLIQQKAYTVTLDTDTCGYIRAAVVEDIACPAIAPGSGLTYPITSYSNTYTITNITNVAKVVTLERHSDWCPDLPFGYQGGPSGPYCYGNSINSGRYDVTLNPGETREIKIDRASDTGVACGSFQTDLWLFAVDGDTACHGRFNDKLIAGGFCATGLDCSSPAMCLNVKAYSSTWTLLTGAQLSALSPNTVVNFCVAGSTGTGAFDKAQFKIGSSLKPETTTKRPSSEDFCQSYTIQSTDTTIDVKAKIHHATLGWFGEAI